MKMKVFAPTEEELQLADDILNRTSCEQAGALIADAAIDIFQRSGLPASTLRDIWAVADEDQSGHLSKQELTIAIRLMGWAQDGEIIKLELLDKAGPLPTLEGFCEVIRKRRHSPSPVPTPQPIQYPPVNSDDLRNFHAVFLEAEPSGGFLHGDKVMDIFMSYDLIHYSKLYEVRKLVDITDRGSLEFAEFALGMHLLEALQSGKISAIPFSVPMDLYQQCSNTETLDHLSPLPPQPSHGPTSSPVLRPSLSRSSFPPSLPPVDSIAEGDEWDVMPHEKLEYDKMFLKLDPERKDYIDGATAAKFMLAYQLPSAELAQIWDLADIENDHRLTRDEFAVAMHLIKQKQIGEAIPLTLPPSLVPPSMRTKQVKRPVPPPHPPQPPRLLPKRSLKPKPPPPPKPESHRRSATLTPRTSSAALAISALSGPSKYASPLTPPGSPQEIRRGASVAAFHAMAGPTSPIRPTPPDLLSPFADPDHLFPPEPEPEPITKSVPNTPTPPEVSTAQHNEVIETFQKETSRLTLQVESLLEQLKAQNKLREAHDELKTQNDFLKAQVREMEKTMQEVLSANEQNGSQEQYIQEIGRLTAELANKESQYENSERMLAVVTGEDTELRTQLRDVQSTAAKAKNELDDARQVVENQNKDIKDLNARLEDMEKALAEPTNAGNNREMRVLFRDVTRENENLKVEIRDMKQSMETLLLSSKFHAKHDELERENRRLKQHVQELEIIATQLQSSVQENAAGRGAESTARENDQLKAKLREGQAAYTSLRSTSEAKVEELQQQLNSLSQENTRLKVEADATGRSHRQEDNSVPPPAYDDTFID